MYVVFLGHFPQSKGPLIDLFPLRSLSSFFCSYISNKAEKGLFRQISIYILGECQMCSA